MNHVILIGRICQTPEMRTTETGKTNTRFSIAVNRPFKNEDGTNQVDFINCTAWGKTAENIAKYTDKGYMVAVDGKIQVRKYEDKMKQTKVIVEVLVETCNFLSNKKEEKTDSQIIQNVMNDRDPFAEFGEEVALSDDELPF